MHNFGIKCFYKGTYAMQVFSITLTNYLTKRYNVNIADAMMIIDEEWDYIEEDYNINNNSVENIAKNLIDIYMVA